MLTNIRDLKKSFSPNVSNLDKIKSISLDDVCVESAVPSTILPIWTKDYLRWRFLSYPNREYFIINNPQVFAISMVGHRGKLKDVHILYIVSKQEHTPTCRLTGQIVRKIREEIQPDIISYSSSILLSYRMSFLFMFFCLIFYH